MLLCMHAANELPLANSDVIIKDVTYLDATTIDVCSASSTRYNSRTSLLLPTWHNDEGSKTPQIES